MMIYFFKKIIWGIHSVVVILFYKIIKGKRINADWVQHIEKGVRITIASGTGILSAERACHIKRGTQLHISGEGNLTIGKHVCINSNCYIASRKKICIGDRCEFGPNVVVVDHDHDFRSKNGISDGKYKLGSVIIGNNVWIGANSVILKGTILGDNCVVGAGSVISGEYLPNTIIIQKREVVTKVYGRECYE